MTFSMILSLVIGSIAIIVVGLAIIKGYNAKGVLFSMGILLMIISALMGKPILEEGATDIIPNDISIYIYDLFAHRGGGLGLIIMILIGFSAYMSHVGANNVVIDVLSKPLHKINSPYLLLVGGFILGSLMSFTINSATALGVFLMATLFPIMIRMGISVPSAAAICATTAVVNLSPTSADVVLAAEKAGAELIPFSFYTIVPMSLIAIVVIAITHFFWQRFCDRQEGLLDNAHQVTTEFAQVQSSENQTKAPTYYFILPFLPIVLIILFNGKLTLFGYTLPELTLGPIIVLTILITAVLEFLRSFDAQYTFAGLEVCYKGMAEAFSAVVVLLVAAGIFAKSLTIIGFTTALIQTVQSADAAGVIMMLALVIITLLVSIAAGSGNAAFFAFVELAPQLAMQLGINPAYLIAPMMQVSNTGRAMSPVSGVMVAVSGAAKISPLLLVKRTSVPLLAGVAVIVLYTMLFIPIKL